jgi:hypothetical protein
VSPTPMIEFWAHENCAVEIEENGDSQRRSGDR